MFKWVQQQYVTPGPDPTTPAHHPGTTNLTLILPRVANVAGTQEPIYGPSAIRSVAEEAKTTPYTELTRDDLKWQTPDSTSVENAVLLLYDGRRCARVCQIIFSNVAYVLWACFFAGCDLHVMQRHPHHLPVQPQDFPAPTRPRRGPPGGAPPTCGARPSSATTTLTRTRRLSTPTTARSKALG